MTSVDTNSTSRSSSTGSFVFDKIKKSRKIKDYLAGRGIYPSSSSPERSVYLCPFPDHKDKAPSFIVYDKGDCDDYFCFGCKKNGSIIQIYAALENISIKRAVYDLSAGLGITSTDHLESLILEIINDKTNESEVDISEDSFLISDIMFRYLKRCKFDPIELEVAEKLFRQIDRFSECNMKDNIKEIVEKLPDILEKRMKIFSQRKETEEIENVKEFRAYKNIP